MDTLQLFHFIGKCLSIDHQPEARQQVEAVLAGGHISYEGLVWVSSHHLVLPALYSALKRHGLLTLLPADLSAHLENLWQMNLQRNRSILDQATRLGSALSGEGIRPLFLKGTAYLMQGLFFDEGDRIMIDIDLLVEKHQAPQALELLSDMGYRSVSGETPQNHQDHHHYPMMHQPGEAAAIELHHQLTHQTYMRFLRTEEVFGQARPLPDGNAAVMDYKHQIILHFIHDQLVHWQFQNRSQTLRGLYDFYLLSLDSGLNEMAPMAARYQRKFNAYSLLVANTFGFPPSVHARPTLYARWYLFTFNLLNRGTKTSVMLKNVVIRFNRMTYLTTFVLKAFYRGDKRRHIIRKIRKLFQRNTDA